MRAGILIAIACAACGFGPPAGLDGPAGDGDRDGDGIADALDLCPDDVIPEQRDHDGDRRGDACDRCPHLASTDDPDRDGDGVGDACDPAPDLTGDRRALWIGFEAADAARLADPAEWGQFGRAWSLGDGWARVDSLGENSISVLYHVPALAGPAAVASRIRLDDVSGGNAAAGTIAGLVFANNSLRQLYQCALFKSQKRIGARSIVGGSMIANNYTPWPGALANDAMVETTSRFGGGMFECSFTEPPTTVRSTQGTTAGIVQLIVQDAVASFDYLFVVEQGS